MAIQRVNQIRPHYYDRNASSGYVAFASENIAPHAGLVRSTSTIASGKKALVDATSITITRQTVATVNGMVVVYAAWTPSGGSATVYQLNNIFQNTVGASVQVAHGGSIALFPGDAISLTTGDASTGGTIAYFIYARYITFDA